MLLHERKQKKEEFIELRGFHEYSLSKCSEILNVSKPTLITWEQENIEAIASVRRAHFNQIVDSLELSLKGRLERLTELNKMLKEELDNRGLSKLSDEKLLKVYLESLMRVDSFINAHSLKNSRSKLDILF